MLSTTLAYLVSNSEYELPDDPNTYASTIMMEGVSVTCTTLAGNTMVANFADAPFSPYMGSGFKWEFTGLPAHTMVLVTTSFWDETSQSGSDVDDLVIKVGSNTRTYSMFASGGSFTGKGGWLASDSGSLTVEVSAANLESGEDFVFEELILQIYQPTVSVTGGGTQAEDDDTPINFVVSRDLPDNYAYYAGAGNDAIPNTTVNVTRSGTATYEEDYIGNLSTSTTVISSNSTNACFSITPIWDLSLESTETVTFAASSGSGYGLSGDYSISTSLLNKAVATLVAYFVDSVSGDGVDPSATTVCHAGSTRNIVIKVWENDNVTSRDLEVDVGTTALTATVGVQQGGGGYPVTISVPAGTTPLTRTIFVKIKNSNILLAIPVKTP